MSIQRLTADTRNKINWASGTSTEIFIYPADASFAERNFLFRISTATVEAEESNFTFFEGITRHLMILKGELDLIHEGRYSKHLKPFDQDIFSGEWSTRSKGKVTDFNLMLKNGPTGLLTHHSMSAGLNVTLAVKTGFYFIYFASGKALCNGIPANATDLFCFDNETSVSIHAQSACDIIEIKVSLNNNGLSDDA